MFLTIIRCLSDTGRRSLIWVCSLSCPTLRVFHLYFFPAGFPGCGSVFRTAGWWQTCGGGRISWRDQLDSWPSAGDHQSWQFYSFNPCTPPGGGAVPIPSCARVGEQTRGWRFRSVGCLAKFGLQTGLHEEPGSSRSMLWLFTAAEHKPSERPQLSHR